MVIAIHQPQYMPWTGYFHKMASADCFVLLDNVQFKKNEWQHRNRIRGPNGAQWLSVPTTYRFPQLISEVTIADDATWRMKHLRSIEACYRKSKWYYDYFPDIERFLVQDHVMLAPCNIASVKMLAGCLGIATPVEIASSYAFDGVATERLVAICRHFGADTYLAGAGGHDYMDLSLFEAAGITVRFQEFEPPRYLQGFCTNEEEFIAGLSALDLLFNCGPESLPILMGGRRG